MERVTKSFNWKSPEQPLDRSNNDMISLIDILATLDEWVRSRPAPKRTLRQIVLERLEAAAPKGTKAAAIRAYAKDNLQSVELVEELSHMRATEVVSPSSDDRRILRSNSPR